MHLPPKICPECSEEYLHSASVCIHCEVDLVLEGEQPEGPQRDEMPPISELVCVRASSVGWAMSLSEKLAEAGIPHRIQAASTDDDDGERRKPGRTLPYGIYVYPEHEGAASKIDRAHTEYQIPDIPEDHDPSAVSEDSCPACGESIVAAESECPGCGLALQAPE